MMQLSEDILCTCQAFDSSVCKHVACQKPTSSIALIEPIHLPQPGEMLALEPNGHVRPEALQTYIAARKQEVAKRLLVVLDNDVVQRWLEEFSEASLYTEAGDGQYLGESSAESQTLAALQRVKSTCQTRNACEIVAAVEDFIHFFCGFHTINAKCLLNAVHFQYAVDVPKLLATVIMPPSAGDAPSQNVKDLFDASEIVSAELLLRAVVETDDGSLIGNPYSAEIGRAHV